MFKDNPNHAGPSVGTAVEQSSGGLTPGAPEPASSGNGGPPEGPKRVFPLPTDPTDPDYVYPDRARMVSSDLIVAVLGKHPGSTREEIFAKIFGPALHKSTKNPQMYMTGSIQSLLDDRVIVKEQDKRDRADVFRLSATPRQPLQGILDFDKGRTGEEKPAAAPRIETKTGPRHSDETKADARDFFHRVARTGIGIDYRYGDIAEDLIADVFTHPYGELPASSRIDGWRRDLHLLALASSPGRRAAAFGQPGHGVAEDRFLDIVREFQLAEADHGRAMMVVIEALSDAQAPSDTSKPWIADAFARIRSMPPTETATSEAPAAPSPETTPAPTRTRAPRKRREPARPIVLTTDPSEALKELALSEFAEDSPAADVVRKYVPLVPRLLDKGQTFETIAQTIFEKGRQVPYDMALALLKRSLANGK